MRCQPPLGVGGSVGLVIHLEGGGGVLDEAVTGDPRE